MSGVHLELPLDVEDQETLEALRRHCPFARGFLDRLLGAAAAGFAYAHSADVLDLALRNLVQRKGPSIVPATELPPINPKDRRNGQG